MRATTTMKRILMLRIERLRFGPPRQRGQAEGQVPILMMHQVHDFLAVADAREARQASADIYAATESDMPAKQIAPRMLKVVLDRNTAGFKNFRVIHCSWAHIFWWCLTRRNSSLKERVPTSIFPESTHWKFLSKRNLLRKLDCIIWSISCVFCIISREHITS